MFEELRASKSTNVQANTVTESTGSGEDVKYLEIRMNQL